MNPARKEIQLNLILAGIGIILVVLGHSDPTRIPDMAGLAAANPAYNGFHEFILWIYTFHMPLFFFLSGLNYLRYTARKNQPFPAFIGSKAKRLLVPYVVFTSLAFPIKAGLSRFAVRGEHLTFGSYIDGLVVPWHNPVIFFWFLPTLFLVFCAAPILWRFCRTWQLAAGMAVVTVGLNLWLPEKDEGALRWLNAAGALHALVFFHAGMIFERFVGEKTVSPFLVVAGLGSAEWFNFCPLPGPTAKLVFSLLGILGAMGLARWWLARPQTLGAIGDYSFQIYLFSWFPQIAVRVGLGQILHVPLWPVVVTMFGGGLLLPIMAARMLDARVPRPLRFIYGR